MRTNPRKEGSNAVNPKEAAIQSIKNLKQNQNGDFIADISTSDLFDSGFESNKVLTLYAGSDEGGVKIFDKSTKKQITELDDSAWYSLYVYIETNKHFLTSREVLFEVESADEKDWEIEPVDVVGDDGEILGKIATSVEPGQEGKPVYSVIFISADGTWSTLSMYFDSLLTKRLAKKDLASIAASINNFIELIK